MKRHSKPYDPVKRNKRTFEGKTNGRQLRKSPEALNPGGVSQPRRQDKAA